MICPICFQKSLFSFADNTYFCVKHIIRFNFVNENEWTFFCLKENRFICTKRKGKLFKSAEFSSEILDNLNKILKNKAFI